MNSRGEQSRQQDESYLRDTSAHEEQGNGQGHKDRGSVISVDESDRPYNDCRPKTDCEDPCQQVVLDNREGSDRWEKHSAGGSVALENRMDSVNGSADTNHRAKDGYEERGGTILRSAS